MAPRAGEILFVDTNVLLTATDELRPHHQAAQRLIAESGARGVHLAVSGQILREYLVDATPRGEWSRPAGHRRGRERGGFPALFPSLRGE